MFGLRAGTLLRQLAHGATVRRRPRSLCGRWQRSGSRRAPHCTYFDPFREETFPADDAKEDAVAHGPLHGVRVLDMSRILAGPFCAMTLGDLGAEVIKVEQPGCGDDTRSWGPPFVGDEATYFLAVNKNKKSITVNLRSEEGQGIVRDLAAKSDVLIENYLPGKLASFHLGYDDLAAVNPGLVYCSVTGFGHTGVRSLEPAYDVAIAALGGLLSVTGHEDSGPAKPGVALVDVLTGLQAHGAILAALRHRDITGRGQHVDCCLFDTQIASLVNVASSVLNAGAVPQRWGTAHSSIVPYQSFRFLDGDMVVAAMNDAQFQRLADVVGKPEWKTDERFATNPARVKDRDHLLDYLQKRFAEGTRDEWEPVLHANKLVVARVNTVAEGLAEQQVADRNMVVEVDHPTAGTVKLPGVPVHFSHTPTPVRHAPPTLGQHTDEVLQDVLGWHVDAVRAAREAGAI